MRYRTDKPSALVVYKGEETVGVFGSYKEAAEHMGVSVGTVKFYASPTQRKRHPGSTRCTIVERIYDDEA